MLHRLVDQDTIDKVPLLRAERDWAVAVSVQPAPVPDLVVCAKAGGERDGMGKGWATPMRWELELAARRLCDELR